jgi:short-subunit dehydrogenase
VSEGWGHTALVTGASSGIGRSFATLLAEKGYDVVLVARRRQRLERLKASLTSTYGVRAEVICVDLADPAAPRNIQAELDEMGLTVDFLVNNAGFFILGYYADVPWESQEEYLRVVGTSVLELTRYLLPGMLDKGWGRIVNVTSMSGYLSGSPGQSLYSPVKAMVHKFSESVSLEYQHKGIVCTSAAPGPTATRFLEAGGATAAEYGRSSRAMQALVMSPDTFVAKAYRGCMRGKRVVVPGVHNKLWALALVHAPGRVRYAMSAFTAKMAPER